MVNYGEGFAILNGFKFSLSWDSQGIASHFMHALLNRLGVQRGNYDELGHLIVNTRPGPPGTFLCISNPHDKELEGRIHFTDGQHRRRQVPLLGSMTFRRQGGRIAVADIRVSKRFTVVHATGYSVEYRSSKNTIELVTVADTGEETEIALRVPIAPSEYRTTGGTVEEWKYREDESEWSARLRHEDRELTLRVECGNSQGV